MSTQYMPIAAEDRRQFIANEAFAFGSDLAEAERWVNEGPIGDMRGLYDDGKLVSQMVVFPFRVMTGGTSSQPMAGIGGVSTPPNYRRKGYVEEMLLQGCHEMRERGTALSMLFPFKTSFYARFGWGTCMERRAYTGAPELFSSFLRQQHGSFVAAGESDIDELNRIYSGALSWRFGPLVRDTYWWQKDVLTAGKLVRQAYIWRDEQGRGRSYIIYDLEKRPQGRVLVCREIVALDPDARAQLFALIANHDSQCVEATFRAPADAPVNMLMPNPLKCEIEPYFMLRLVDVAKALENYTFPRELSGTLRLSVADAWLADNQGVYEIEVANGTGQVRRLPDSTETDLHCDVRVLAQIYTRYLRPRSAATFGLIRSTDRGSLTMFNRMFAGLVPFSSDFF